MYKVLIIDDEEPAREAIKILADWDSINVYEVFEAWDGKNGIRLIEEKKPDIILVDMKMPEMDGMELLRIVESKYPDLAIIVISGYDNYEYTHQAIHSKVIDYLLKPIKRNELNDALAKAIDTISNRRKMQSQYIDRNILLNLSLPSLKEKLYMAAIEGSISKQMREIYRELIDTECSIKHYSVSVFRIMNLDEVSDKYFNEVSLTQFAISNAINELFNDGFECFNFVNPKNSNEIIVIISFKGEFNEKQKANYLHLIQKTRRKLNQLFELIIMVGAGGFHEGIDSLKKSFLEAEKLIGSINLLNNNDGIICDMPEDINKMKISLLDKKDLIFNAIEGGSLTYTKEIIKEFVDKIEQTGVLTLRDANRIFDELMLIFNNFSMIKEFDANELISYFKSLSRTVCNFEQFKKYLLDFIELFYNLSKKQLGNDNFNIYEVKEFIDSNYCQDIKISLFTNKYFLSREYLMKLFKDEFGCGIYEYVIKVRMEKARELLADPDIKINKISQMLGYSDNNYFSKAFKNYFGISPSDYRNTLIS
ncbi:MAG TPA: response regulator [Clostridiaceae bacterium]|nr:response regulator [Clostridiaceae bacterium]